MAEGFLHFVGEEATEKTSFQSSDVNEVTITFFAEHYT